MISSPISKFFRLLALCCCCALGACDRNSEPAQTPTATPTQKAKSSVRTSAADPLAGMVKAAAADTRQQPFELRFELTARPQMGEAVDVKLNLLGIDEATDVKLAVSADPKLAIIDGGQASFQSLKPGESVNHTVILRGTDTGIFVVDVRLQATVNGGPRTANYAVPVALVPAASAAADAAPTATAADH